jgi:site-specific recombinase XerD
MDFNKLLSRFERYLIDHKGRTSNTGKTYKYHAKNYLDFLKETGAENSQPIIDPDFFGDYIAWLRNRTNKKGERLKDTTIASKSYGVYAFWKYLYLRPKIVDAPVPYEELDMRFYKDHVPTIVIPFEDYKLLQEVVNNELSRIR